ncbi:hypothetical protein MU516_15545 [Paracoccus sp. YLB-12]|uniref:Transposase n=1 Tax=Paracoccus maritimus TaxID=2933292 RepID=A0ABT2KEN2_9RHOB|nr:hypothetical protein [Paracoccus sp. YLB-12]MCT4334279.1 hypothetical protein [Paracoccus sp. YLB-12]
MEYYAGLDVSLRSCALCIIDEKGTVRLERELPCEVEAIADALARFTNLVTRLGFEAGTMSQHLYFGLRDRSANTPSNATSLWNMPLWIMWAIISVRNRKIGGLRASVNWSSGGRVNCCSAYVIMDIGCLMQRHNVKG